MIDVLGRWGARWAFGDPRVTELDPVVLLWWMKRRVYRQRLPAGRTVIEFEFRRGHVGTYWLVLERADVSVCLQHPKFEIDLRIAADIGQFYRVWLGRVPLRSAVADGTVRLHGAPSAVRGLPTGSRGARWRPRCARPHRRVHRAPRVLSFQRRAWYRSPISPTSPPTEVSHAVRQHHHL